MLHFVIQGLITSVAEVVAVGGFVFGVACKLPPSLTILLLNGVFWFVIARHFIWDIVCNRNNHRTEGHQDCEEYISDKYTLCLKRKLMPLLKFVAFLIQLGVLISVPIILAHTEHLYNKESNENVILYVLIPTTLMFISIIWSGCLQKYSSKPGIKKKSTVTGEGYIARLKSGEFKIHTLILA